MSDNYSTTCYIELYENEHNRAKEAVHESILKFQRLVSIFESEESDSKLKFLSQKKSTAETPVMMADVPVTIADAPVTMAETVTVDTETDGAPANGDMPSAEEVAGLGASAGIGTTASRTASGVAVMRYADGDVGHWLPRAEPKRNLLVVVHPWCKFRNPSADRQSEFPPPGFLDSLKAKLQMATVRQREQDEPTASDQGPAVVRKRRCDQKIKYWLQYTAAAAALAAGPSRAKKINAGSAACGGSSPRAVDLITVWQRYAKLAMASDKTNR